MSQENTSIKNWSLKDRPREKLLALGAGALSESELIAILIGSGNRNMSAVDLSRLIFDKAGQSLDTLGKMSIKQLTQHKGVGQAKAVTIAAALEIGRRRASETIAEKPKVTSSDSAYHILRPILGELPHEEFWILYLNNSNKVLATQQISKGGFTGTYVDIRIVMKKALEENAVAMILAHNHPSGQLVPSAADEQLTQKMVQAAQLLDLRILDHLIVTQKGYFSFADQGKL